MKKMSLVTKTRTGKNQEELSLAASVVGQVAGGRQGKADPAAAARGQLCDSRSRQLHPRLQLRVPGTTPGFLPPAFKLISAISKTRTG